MRGGGHTWADLVALRPKWQETFDESMPMGFEIGPDQAPMMHRCIREKSRAPLEQCIKSLDDDVKF